MDVALFWKAVFLISVGTDVFHHGEQPHPPVALGAGEHVHGEGARQEFRPRAVSTGRPRSVGLGAGCGRLLRGRLRRDAGPPLAGRREHARVAHGVEAWRRHAGGQAAQQRIERGHPWVFRSDVVKDGGASPGAVVRVADVRGTPLGFAFWSSRSEIRLRMFERGETLAEGFLGYRIERALRWRETVAAGAEAYRVVHGEGDGLPSLVVDRYGDYLSIQTLSQGTERAKADMVRVDVRKGQKTGLFLDRRENHLAARQYARGRVLDGFTYDGGFALQVARQSDEVTAVDLSAESLERVKANASLNGLANVTARDANVFDLLKELDQRGERFDTVILDPPAFATSKDAVEKAARGYKEISLKIVRPGGCLVTCSCSYHVHEEDFEAILADAAVDARVAVSVVEKRRQARDHPVVLGVPETLYLKCSVLRKLD